MRIEDPDAKKSYVLINSETDEWLREALEEAEDNRERAAFLRTSHRSSVEWMKQNLWITPIERSEGR